MGAHDGERQMAATFRPALMLTERVRRCEHARECFTPLFATTVLYILHGSGRRQQAFFPTMLSLATITATTTAVVAALSTKSKRAIEQRRTQSPIHGDGMPHQRQSESSDVSLTQPLLRMKNETKG